MVLKVHFPADITSNPSHLITPGLEFAGLLLNYYNCIFRAQARKAQGPIVFVRILLFLFFLFFEKKNLTKLQNLMCSSHILARIHMKLGTHIDLIEPNNFCAACHGLRPTGSRLFRAV